MKLTWKDIAPVPTSKELLDIVLSRTQRRLPTQIRSGFQISRIRNFYTRKVKFTAEQFVEKLDATINGFPKLNDCHPFHRDLMNTLYDADHFRIALGKLARAKTLIETVARDHVRLIKYGQSLYQCKQLKRAALGRMATISSKLKDELVYLEQVRQHLGRLPSIDPNTRTLLICGYPNVGKSSFLKAISRADVDVQPYAFTTKSLFVGHFDYKMLRFQAIDTPGILDHALEEMNTIEMQSVTAIAHLRSAVLYFMDLSEHCGYTVDAQVQLYKNIKPLFANKLTFIVVNKTDLLVPEVLNEIIEDKLQEILKTGEAELLQISCAQELNVMAARNAACDRLIAVRNSEKLKAGTNSSGEPTGRLGELLRRIHVAQPLGGVTRETFIPEAVKTKAKYDFNDPNRKPLEKDLETEAGGPGIYSIDLQRNWMLENDEWRRDKQPEVYEGMNVSDFVDPDIARKLQELEDEEEKLEQEGYYDDDAELTDDEVQEIRYKAELIREKRQLIRNEARTRKASMRNKAVIPRSAKAKKMSEMEKGLQSLGYDTASISARARSQSRGRPRGRSEANTPGADAMDLDETPKERLKRALSRPRSVSQHGNRREDGVVSDVARAKADRLAKLGQHRMNRMARQGEADRHTTAAMPKHLFSGKRGNGKTQSR